MLRTGGGAVARCVWLTICSVYWWALQKQVLEAAAKAHATLATGELQVSLPISESLEYVWHVCIYEYLERQGDRDRSAYSV